MFAPAMPPMMRATNSIASEVDKALREAPVSLDWLDNHFVEAAVTPAGASR